MVCVVEVPLCSWWKHWLFVLCGGCIMA